MCKKFVFAGDNVANVSLQKQTFCTPEYTYKTLLSFMNQGIEGFRIKGLPYGLADKCHQKQSNE